MGLISRMSMVVRSKMNKFLDDVEDPRETLEYSLEQQREQLQKVKRDVTTVVSSKHRIRQQAEKAKADVSRYEQQAADAMAQGREDLARMALERKFEVEARLEGLETQLDGMEKEQERLIQAENRLQAKVEAFKHRKEVIIAEYTSAEAQVAIAEAVSGLSEEMSNAGLSMDRAAEKTESMKARAAAIDELVEIGTLEDGLNQGDAVDRELAKMSANANIEAELDRLRTANKPATPATADAP